MTQKPISIPISFLVLVASSALAGPGYFEAPVAVREKSGVRTDPAPCLQGEAYTCTLQCGPTTRTAFDRLVVNPGVEACVVTKCGCEVVLEPVNLNDPTQPTALVIFGVRQILPKPPN